MLKTTVVEQKLGRENAAGMAQKETRVIKIDPRLAPLDYLQTLCHEMLHIEFPALSETKVQRIGQRFGKILWKQNYRKMVL